MADPSIQLGRAYLQLFFEMLTPPGVIIKGVLMKKFCEALIGGVLLGVLFMAPALLAIWEERAAPAHRSSLNSCRQLDSVERKCDTVRATGG